MTARGETGGIARTLDENELFDDGRPDDRSDSGAVEEGTVGWNDGSTHFDPGTSDNGGVWFVRVCLRRGRDHSQALTPGRAQGTQIIARIPNPNAWVPPDGTHVLVARPAGSDAWCLLQAYGPNPTDQFSGNSGATQGATNRAKQDYGPNTDLLIKARSITLCDYDDRYFTLGPDFGFKMGDADGHGWSFKSGQWLAWVATGSPPAAKSFIKIDSSGIQVAIGDDALGNTGIDIVAGTVKLFGQTFSCLTGNVALGILASPATPVVLGTTGISGVGSLSIFGQP